MTRDDTGNQIPLFELPKAEAPTPKEQAPGKPVARKKPAPKETSARKPALAKQTRREAAAPAKGAKSLSGLVPEGDVRLTANIRQDLHLKLKIAAAQRRTTIGEIIEELVAKHVR
jgi:hypothetical protein